jgi:hypothetical protein
MAGFARLLATLSLLKTNSLAGIVADQWSCCGFALALKSAKNIVRT